MYILFYYYYYLIHIIKDIDIFRYCFFFFFGRGLEMVRKLVNNRIIGKS